MKMGKNILEIEIIDDSGNFPQDQKKRKTSNLMTKYEYTRILSYRAIQISNGIDNPRIDIEGVYEPIEIARRELHERVIPLGIQRTLMNGEKEFWNVKDMIINNY